MLFLRYLLIIAGFGLFAGAAAILVYDLYVIFKGRKPAQDAPRPFQEGRKAPRTSCCSGGPKTASFIALSAPRVGQAIGLSGLSLTLLL
jgi:hypothetical protein